MRKTVLTFLKVMAWVLLVALWCTIEISMLLSWFSIMIYSVGGWIPLIIVNGLLAIAFIYRRKIKMSLLKSFACVTIIGILISGIAFLGINAYSNDFTSYKWKNYPAGRSAMIEDLEKEYDLVGMSKDEIIELLGEPNHVSQFLYGYETYEFYNQHAYWIGYRYLVNFDEDGIVISTYHTFD